MPSPLLALALLAALTVVAWRRRATPSRLARLRHVLAVLTFWTWVCCTPAITNRFVARLEGPPPRGSTEDVDARSAPGGSIIVLGSGEMWTPSGQTAPRLDENGWERLHEGVRLWRRTGGTLVFTGGPGGAEQPTLAGQMGSIAQELGVPRQHLAYAVRSRTTYEDLVAARPLLGDGPVWLVTSAIHMPRAMAVARELGIAATPYRVDYRQIRNVTWRAWIPDNASADRMAAATHEVVGRLYYSSRGWAAPVGAH